jgi:hypothetical protein
MILTDNETRVDLLNNEAIAKTIISLLQEQPARPVTIGVHGDWGAGKSSILEMIEAGLDGKDDTLCLKFNGWRFQGFEDAKIALIEGIVTGLIAKRPALTKAAGVVKDLFARIDWLKVARHAGGLAFTAFTGIPTPDQIHAILGGLESMLADPATLATKANLDTAIDGVKGLLKEKPETKNVPEEISEFRKAFDKLLSDAGIKQLVVLIDDLDRCLPDTAIETLEAVRLFVFTAHTAFVVAADEAMIEHAVRKHFPELPDTTGPRDYARNYLEKLIQVPFRIPALGETETRIYVTSLLIGARLGEDDPDYVRLIAVARERLKTPWKSEPLDATAIKSALGAKATAVQNEHILSDQISPILAAGARGNPRQIKRFLNTLLLRQRMADARGFGSDIKLPVLAKLMLAERFIPRLFEQIASASAADPKGVCQELALLEAAATDSKPRRHNDKRRAADAEHGDAGDRESALLAEWNSSQPICAWAAVEPSLANIDLRPYFFVSKDKKDYFGPLSTLGHLSTVVEKLLGPKLIVQRMEPDLQRLVGSEAAQVFEALRSRIMGGDDFETEPPGIAGITVLVKAQPALQNTLLDFLEALPTDRCGAWVASGWQSAIVDQAALARFNRLLETWSKSAKNAALRTTATGALKLPHIRGL